MKGRWVGLMAIAVLVAVGAAACGGRQAAPPAQPQAPQAQPAAPGEGTVVVTTREFGFTLSATEVPAGRVRFVVRNEGTVEHDFVIVELDKRTPQIRPGQTEELVADLQPGTYTLVCEVPGHKEAGMTAKLVVR